MEVQLSSPSYTQLFKKLKGFADRRYHAISRYPNAPGFRFHMNHLENIRYMLNQALVSTDQRFWARLIISRGTVNLFAITTKTDEQRKEKELALITECLDALREKTGRKAA